METKVDTAVPPPTKSLFGQKMRVRLAVLIMYLTSTFGSMFMLFPLVPLRWLHQRLFHTLSDACLHAWFGLTVFLLERLCQIKICLHRSKRNRGSHSMLPNSSSIVIMNHRTRLDWMFYFCVLYQINKLSNIKIILKDSLKYIPGPGWAMQSALFIFIKRKWESDRDIFTKFIRYYKQIEKKICILIFPEGTNLTEDTKKKSDIFAFDHNLPRYEQVLHPRVTGFIHVYNEMTKVDALDCVHDVTVAYRGGVIPRSELEFVNGAVPHEIHFFFEEINCKEIVPARLDGGNKAVEKRILEEWLLERWKMKETLLENFYLEESSGKSSAITHDWEEAHVSDSRMLVVFPIYWSLSCAFMLYLSYAYFAAQVFFVLSIVFYTWLQFSGGGIDSFLMNGGLAARKTDEQHIQNKKAE